MRAVFVWCCNDPNHRLLVDFRVARVGRRSLGTDVLALKPNNEKREHYYLLRMQGNISFRSTEKIKELEDLIEAKSSYTLYAYQDTQ